MRTVKVPYIYKHFKGKYYATMAVSVPVTEQAIIYNEEAYKYFATHTETCNTIQLYGNSDRMLFHKVSECPDVLVIYKSLYNNAVAYARPYKMFLSEVDKEKYPNATQEYRLEEVPLEDVLEI